ncbi:uncharacterized protein V6R79_008224 [Siganus canaliculatus]
MLRVVLEHIVLRPFCSPSKGSERVQDGSLSCPALPQKGSTRQVMPQTRSGKNTTLQVDMEVESDIEGVQGCSCGALEQLKLDFHQLKEENQLLKEEIRLLKEENKKLKQEKSCSSEAGSKAGERAARAKVAAAASYVAVEDRDPAGAGPRSGQTPPGDRSQKRRNDRGESSEPAVRKNRAQADVNAAVDLEDSESFEGSSSSSSSSSSEEENRRKGNKGKKQKTRREERCFKAVHPNEVVERCQKVLQHYKTVKKLHTVVQSCRGRPEYDSVHPNEVVERYEEVQHYKNGKNFSRSELSGWIAIRLLELPPLQSLQLLFQSVMSPSRTPRGKKNEENKKTLPVENNFEEVESDIEGVQGCSCGALEQLKLDFHQLKEENQLLKEEIRLLKEENKKLKQEKSCSSEAGSKAVHPNEVVERYQKVLQHYKNGKNFKQSFRAVGVDRNTIVGTAPIAELAIAFPERYEELLEGFSRLQKMQVFVEQCAKFIENHPATMSQVENLKRSGKRLPFCKRK